MTLSADRGTIAEIPILRVGALASADLCRHDLGRMRALVGAAMSRRSHIALPIAARLVDRLSHSWLARQADSYLEEIRDVASLLGRPGAFFLNAVYEWSCSTSIGAAPAGDGARMIRVLDWGLSGLGRHVVIARHDTPHGPFYNATWPGYAGVVTGMAPGRFSAAINQAPRVPVTGCTPLDGAITRLRFLLSQDTVLAGHLLRNVFEAAPDYAAAVAMLMEAKVALSAPALFALSGIAPDEGCVVEAIGRERRLHPIAERAGGALGIANQWLSPDLKGQARNQSTTLAPRLPPEANNAARRALVTRLQAGAFQGSADLVEPVLNSHTVMVISANAGRGEMIVEALDPPPGEILPRVVARRSVRDPVRAAA
jgi:hypothetical protein